MTDEGVRVVSQWLGATNPLEEGEFALLGSCIVQGPPQTAPVFKRVVSVEKVSSLLMFTLPFQSKDR